MASTSSSSTPPPERPAYLEKETLQLAGSAGAKAGGVGVLVSAVQNALDTHNRGAAGVITRSGGTIAFFGELYVFLYVASWTHAGLVGSWDGSYVCVGRSCCGELPKDG